VALPPPLAFESAVVGGEEMMVATLPDSGGDADAEGGGGAGGAPFFLTRAELTGLERFVGERRSDTPQMLMLTGTIKSGKTRVLTTVLPGLLAARLAADPRSRRPVVFLHSFRLNAPVEESASYFADELVAFAASVGLSLPPPTNAPMNALNRLPALLRQLAEYVHSEGGELWLLFDELQAPIIASTPRGASTFIYVLKRAVELCSPFARIVGTGSGMVSLLSAVRRAAPNGFALWDAVSHVTLGREPPAPAALAMAERIVASHARLRRWPQGLAALLTPQRACAELARGAHGERTSPRPALVAYLAGLVGGGLGDARGGEPEFVLKRAVRHVLLKLDDESLRDTVAGLLQLQPSLRMWLRALAVQGPATPLLRQQLEGSYNFKGEAHLEFAALLCEASVPARLLPPYGALLRRLVTRDGDVAAVFSDDRIVLPESVQDSLKCLADFDGSPPSSPFHITPATCAAISADVLDSLASNGVGVVEGGLAARAPRSVAEIRKVAAVAQVLAALDALHAAAAKPCVPRASDALVKAERASPEEQAAFVARIGLQFLIWLRHFEGHTRLDADVASRSGLTEAIIAEAVRAAAEALVQRQGSAFEVDSEGALRAAAGEGADKGADDDADDDADADDDVDDDEEDADLYRADDGAGALPVVPAGRALGRAAARTAIPKTALAVR
jgi:hypothetical protein